MCRISAVEMLHYPVLRITFSDGFSGDYDLSDVIHPDTAFAPLMDKAFFATVGVAENGRAFGWNLNDLGHEIDFCADATRITLETQAVMALADTYAATLVAAE